MRKITLLLSVSVLLLAASCSSKKNAEGTNAGLGSKITEAEKKLNPQKPDAAHISHLLRLYNRYADSLPQDSITPYYLVKAADLYHFQGQYRQQCNTYQRIVEHYPQFRDIDMVLYLYAFSLDSELNMREKAKAQYQLYLEKYPQSQYANDARVRLETIDSLSFRELEEKITQQVMDQAH